MLFPGVRFKAYHLFCLENAQIQVKSPLGTVSSEYIVMKCNFFQENFLETVSSLDLN